MELDALRTAYAGLPCRPLQVQVDLLTPLATGPDPLCLDALLADRVALRLFGAAARDRSRAMVDLPLPLRRTGEVWHASIGFPAPGAPGQDWLAKRWAVDPPPGASERLGWSRAYHMPVRYLATPSLVFWANGNLEEIRRLLSGLQAIGKHRKKGFGQVRRVTVRPAARDWSLWRAGQPQRPIPVHQVPGPWTCYIGVTGFRPPAWDPRNQGLCVMPPPDVWLQAYGGAARDTVLDPDEADWCGDGGMP